MMHALPHRSALRPALLVLVCLLGNGPAAVAEQRSEQALVPPDDPRQSITYWKQHTITADEDPQVATSHAVFSVLLRGWDNSRLEPGLYVVNSGSGAWAASLADGNILLSRDAIDACMQFGEQRGRHLLAFVLSHELAHQHADDLWHQRFFRMVGNDSPATREKMLRDLQLDADTIAGAQQKEAQADHDGLILMASVGYDPYQVIATDKTGGRDFFTLWVENLWQQTCDQSASATQDSHFRSACEQAQSRALRSRAQLRHVATQSMLYELGVQAFVAGDYHKAREYFTAYGRDYPSRAVLSALGLTWLAEALTLHRELRHAGIIQQPDFYYPLMLDASADEGTLSRSDKRAATDSFYADKQKTMRKALQQAMTLFEKAIRLQPSHRKSYLLLATAHLLDNNPYMVRGILQGRYLQKFGHDPSVDMLLAMTSAVENKADEAERAFHALLDKLEQQPATSTSADAMPANLLRYSATYNRAALARWRGNDKLAQSLWQKLARQAKSDGNSLLFNMALAQLSHHAIAAAGLKQAPTVGNKRLGDGVAASSQHTNGHDELWIDGEKLQVIRRSDGSRYITDSSGRIISATQSGGKANIANILFIGDAAGRPFKSLGMPDRRVDMPSGEYLAYDRYGLALHILDNRISGWFLYDTP